MNHLKFDNDLQYFSKNKSEKRMMILATSSSIDNLQSLVGEKGGMSRLEFDRKLLEEGHSTALNFLKRLFINIFSYTGFKR
jgi:hypothetical protein